MIVYLSSLGEVFSCCYSDFNTRSQIPISQRSRGITDVASCRCSLVPCSMSQVELINETWSYLKKSKIKWWKLHNIPSVVIKFITSRETERKRSEKFYNMWEWKVLFLYFSMKNSTVFVCVQFITKQLLLYTTVILVCAVALPGGCNNRSPPRPAASARWDDAFTKLYYWNYAL